MRYEWILTGQEIDKTLDLGYIRVAGLHRECKPAVLFDPPNFRPRTMTHNVLTYVLCIPLNAQNIYICVHMSIVHVLYVPAEYCGQTLRVCLCLFHTRWVCLMVGQWIGRLFAHTC